MIREYTRMLEVLRRRISYLNKQVAFGEARGQDFTYDKAERQALEWVIELVEKCDSEGVLEALSPPRGRR